jgi:hypothetical protein
MKFMLPMGLRISLHGNRAYVAVPSARDPLEPPALEQSLLTPGLVQRYLDDVESLLSLVGDLQLNARIWGE